MIRKKSAKFIVFVSALVLMLSGSAYAGTVNTPPLFVTDAQFMDCMATNIAQVPKDITLVIYDSSGTAVVGPQDF